MHVRIAVLWHDTLIHEAIYDRDVLVGGKGAPPVPDGAFTPGTALVEMGDHHATCTLPEGRSADVDGVIHHGPAFITLSLGQHARIDLTNCALLVQPVLPERAVPRAPMAGRMDRGLLGGVLLAMTSHLAALVFAFLYYDADPELRTLAIDDRVVIIHSMQAEELPEPPLAEELITEDPGKAARDDPGKFGEPDKKRDSKVAKREGEVVKKPRETGALKALGDMRLGGPLKDIMGNTEGFKNKLGGAMQGMGDVAFRGRGTGGIGIRGTGGGGDGVDFGDGTGKGWDGVGGGSKPRSRLKTKKKRPKKPTVRMLGGSSTEFCKAADIQRVVSARRRGVTYCYDKALSTHPELSGKVTMTWRIGLDGSVSAVRVGSSKLGSSDVESCMKRAIKRWKFPKPNGGICQVRYPFVFNSGL